jgi:hypothetical protein
LAEIGRLGVRVGFPSDRVSGVELTRAQGQELQRLKGQTTYRVLDRLLASEGYQRLDEDQKRKAIEKAVEAARRAGAKASGFHPLPITPRR